MDFDEAALLFKTVNSLTNPRGVEIGRFHGGSTVLLAHAIGSGGFLASIDINHRKDPAIRDLLTRLGMNDRVRLRVGSSQKVGLPKYPLDFVFIDGDHSYEGVKADQERWGAAVRPGGFVIHHDMTKCRRYATQQNGPQRVFFELMDGDEFELFARAGSVAVFQKSA
jgi:predicted O-methyltransferase YrrM